MKRRTFITMLALGSAGLSVRALGKTSGTTFVVAHGAWSAGWAWKKMHPLLTAAGHRLFTPTGYFEKDASHSPFITAPAALTTIPNTIAPAT
jgi:hypothetical protein